MATATYGISETKIKFRYGEPYTSEASNVQMGINEQGVFRGALVQQEAPSNPAKTIRINTEDGDSVILHRDSSTGFCVVVREIANVQLDLTSLFSDGGAIPAGGLTSYVYMTADYSINGSTTGAFEADATLPTGAVALARIDLPAAATQVLDEYIRVDGSNRSRTTPKRFVLVKRQVEISAEVARTGFQLTGKICYMGEDTEDLNKSKVNLLQGGSNGFRLLVGSDGGLVSAGSWYDAEGGSYIGTSDMDEDGCYINPWILLRLSDTVDVSFDSAFYAAYHEAIPFDEWLISDETYGFVGTHSNNVDIKAATGTPDSIPSGTLSDGLDSILGLINARIRTTHDGTSQSDYTLLWRSHDVTDNEVTNDVISIYFKNSDIMMVTGGFFYKPSTTEYIKRVAEETSGTGKMSVIRFDGSDMSLWKQAVFVTAYSMSLRLLVEEDWQTFKEEDFLFGTTLGVRKRGTKYAGWETHIFGEAGGPLGYADAVMRAIPGDASVANNEVPSNILLLELAHLNIRIYWGDSVAENQGYLRIVYNATWDNDNGKWNRVNTRYGPRSVRIGTAGLIMEGQTSTASPWTSWSSYLGWNGTVNCFQAHGKAEWCHFVAFKYQTTTPGRTYYRAAINFRNKGVSVPTVPTATVDLPLNSTEEEDIVFFQTPGITSGVDIQYMGDDTDEWGSSLRFEVYETVSSTYESITGKIRVYS